MFHKIEIYVAIISAITIGVISLFHNISFIEVLTRFVVVIAVSYIFALLLKLYINKLIIKDEIVEEQFNESDLSAEEDANKIENNNTLDNIKDISYNEIGENKNIELEDKNNS